MAFSYHQIHQDNGNISRNCSQVVLKGIVYGSMASNLFTRMVPITRTTTNKLQIDLLESGTTSPKRLRLSEAAGAGVDWYDEEMNNVSRAMEQDRIQKGIWDYLNDQITEMIELCNKAKDWRTDPPTSDVRESCGKRFNELFLCGGKHIELQPIAVRGDPWQHFFDQVAPENVVTPKAMKVDWAATYRDVGMSEGGML